MSPDLALVGSGLLKAVIHILASESGDPPPVGYLNQGDAGLGSGRCVSVRLERIISNPSRGGFDGARCDWLVQVLRNDWPQLAAAVRTAVAPSAEAIDRISTELLGDATRLLVGLVVARNDDWLVEGESGVFSSEFEIGPLGRIPPDSGIAGWQVTLSHPLSVVGLCVTDPYE